MSIDANDLVEGLIDEQARRNAAFQNQPDVNAVVEDIFALTPVETVGFTETVTPVSTNRPHHWDDTPGSNTVWGFWSWDT